MEHVIALVDGSDASLAAARYGECLATSARGRLTVAVHVRSHWAATVEPSSTFPVPADEIEFEVLCRLSGLLAGSVLWNLHTLNGEPARAIAALATDDVDCVVVVGVGASILDWWRAARLSRTLSRRYRLPVILTSAQR